MKHLKISFHLNIGPDYMHRYRLFPVIEWKGKEFYPPFNVFVHHFLKSDKERDLHDHPWPSISILLSKSQVFEIYQSTYGLGKITRHIKRFRPIFRTALHQHRVILKSKDAWTLFAVGPKVREWGFWPGGVFVPWRVYCGLDETETVD